MRAPHNTRVALIKSIWLLFSTGCRTRLFPSVLPNNFCSSHHLGECSLQNCKSLSSHRTIFPSIKLSGMVGKATSKNRGSALSITWKPSLCPNTWITVTAPKVTADQYKEPTITPAATIGAILLTAFSVWSMICKTGPREGYEMVYKVLHCGQNTCVVGFPFCFSSNHLCKQLSWTHFVVPLHWQGLIHFAPGSSSSVPKQTQQVLLQHNGFK